MKVKLDNCSQILWYWWWNCCCWWWARCWSLHKSQQSFSTYTRRKNTKKWDFFWVSYSNVCVKNENGSYWWKGACMYYATIHKTFPSSSHIFLIWRVSWLYIQIPNILQLLGQLPGFSNVTPSDWFTQNLLLTWLKRSLILVGFLSKTTLFKGILGTDNLWRNIPVAGLTDWLCMGHQT